jgi:hypothetical protein
MARYAWAARGAKATKLESIEQDEIKLIFMDFWLSPSLRICAAASQTVLADFVKVVRDS